MSDYPHLRWQTAPSAVSEALARARGLSYLLAADADGRTAVATGNDIPSQALRKTLARAFGRPDQWDWKTSPRRQTKELTLATLQRQAA
jgi:hypothetical protein